MSIVTDQHSVPTTNPPGTITSFPPASVGSFNGVRVSNFSPFTFKVAGAFDDSGTQPVLSPYQVVVYPYNNVRGPLILTPNTLPGSPTLPDNMLITFEFSTDATNDLTGAYPAAIPGQGFTSFSGAVSITGPVTVQSITNPVFGLTNATIVDHFAQSLASPVSRTITVPAGYTSLAIVVKVTGLGSTSFFQLTGSVSGALYFENPLPGVGSWVKYAILNAGWENGQYTITVPASAGSAIDCTVIGLSSSNVVTQMPQDNFRVVDRAATGLPIFLNVAPGSAGTAIAAPGAGKKLCISAISCSLNAGGGATTHDVLLSATPSGANVWASSNQPGTTNSIEFPAGLYLPENSGMAWATTAGVGTQNVYIYLTTVNLTDIPSGL